MLGERNLLVGCFDSFQTLDQFLFFLPVGKPAGQWLIFVPLIAGTGYTKVGSPSTLPFSPVSLYFYVESTQVLRAIALLLGMTYVDVVLCVSDVEVLVDALLVDV